MQEAQQERRAVRRFDMRLPALVSIGGATSGEVHTETQNVSACGIFFYLDQEIAPGAELDVVLTLPPHVTLTDAVRVRLHARVVRVERPRPLSRVGVAVVFENHEFLRSTANAI